MEHIYFAYGSNLHKAQMKQRCPTSKPLHRFTLHDWRLVFRGYADIIPYQGSTVHGALYSVFEPDIEALDLYEGVRHGLYRKEEISVDGVKVFFYVMNDMMFFEPPSGEYFRTIKQGFRDWVLPMTNLEDARRHAQKAYRFT